MTLPVAILAGGLATRMRPVTQRVPKSLLDVAGKPFVSRQLAYLRDQGIRDVVMCIGHLGDQVQDVVGDGGAWDLRVRYSRDGPSLLGTGGALRKALPLLEEQFFVLYGDSFLPVDFAAVARFFTGCGCPALMTILKNSDRWDKSNVAYDGGRILRYDKRNPQSDMQYIDYGLGILSKELLVTSPPKEPLDLADVYQALATSGRLAGFEVTERFYEIGSQTGLQETEQYFRERQEV